MTAAPRKVILIDGNSLLYRAFFAIRFLSTKDGRPTNALYGFANMLLKLLNEEKPYAMLVAFDAPAKTFRHEQYPEYKATRSAPPDELRVQSPLARVLARAMGLPVFEVPGYEADDIVGTCAKQAEECGYNVLIVTGDLDELQLVSEQTSVAVSTKGVSDITVYTPEAVRERFGMDPDLFVDFKALKGDTSDNIPGVPGVGDKTAAKLIQQFGGIDGILARLEELPAGKVRQSIEASREQLPLSRELCTIVTDMPLEVDFSELKPYDRTPGEAEAFFREHEFESLIKRLPEPEQAGQSVEQAAVEFDWPELRLVIAPDELDALLAELEKAEAVSFAVDSASASGLVGLAFAVGQQAWYVQVQGAAAAQGSLSDELDGSFRAEIGRFRELFEDASATKWTHDAKTAYLALEGRGLSLAGVRQDTMLAGFLLQPGRGSYGLDWLGQQYLSIEAPEPSETWESPAFSAWLVSRLAPVLAVKLEEEELAGIYVDIELPLSPVLARMQQEGVQLDCGYLRELSVGLNDQIRALEQEIYQLAGSEFNIGSPKQLAVVLFQTLELPAGKRTKTGWSTDAETLEGLADSYEVAAKVLQWRELTKLKGTYADALPKLADANQRVHTSFNQTGAATGRLSSSDPNLQNIPIKTEAGRGIRAAFTAGPGCTLMAADYSQIELRLLAHMTGDEELLRCFQENEDIHVRTACALFGVALEDVEDDMRRRAKTINFSVIYGKTDYGLSRDLSISVSEAHEYIEAYFRQYPRVREFSQQVLENARREGYVTTLSGRKRWFPELHVRDRNVRANAERAAFNAPLQGTAADIIKRAMIRLDEVLRDQPARMLLQVHDELVFDVECGFEQQVAQIVKREMEGAADLSVPLIVDVKCGQNWRDITRLEV